jgi:uncharacterized protein (DUF1330 family)
MVAYVLIEARTLDETAFNEYVALAEPAVRQYGGRYLAASDDAIALEGVPPTAIYLAEFPSFERMLEWYASPEYQRARQLVPRALARRMIGVDGIRADQSAQ